VLTSAEAPAADAPTARPTARADPAYRGRVTALWSLGLVGSTPIGSPIIGALAELASPRWALALGAAACVAAAAVGHWRTCSPDERG
jgi:MFS family permease